jgi:Skp family chaperone for outer membrane proteins
MNSTLLILTGVVLVFPAEARLRVATLNTQAAIRSTHDGEAAVAELKRKFGAEEARLLEEQREIQNLQSQLEGVADAASLRDRIDTLTARHSRAAEELQRKVDEGQKRILKELNAKLLVVVEQYAKQKHLEIVLDESDPGMPLYWHSRATDITAEVIKRYNRGALTRARQTGGLSY